MTNRYTRAATPGPVFGYLRVSTEDQASSGAGLEAQRAAITAECERRGWLDRLEWVEDAGFSGKSLDRPGIRSALDVLNTRGGVLMVAKLDRLSRSVMDFSTMLEQSKRRGWSLVVLDFGVDMLTPGGEAMGNMMATFAQFERRMIGLRTSEGLRQKKLKGVKLGRPSRIGADALRFILEAAAAGASLRSIARDCNARGYPTAQGGRCWYPATVRKVLLSENCCAIERKRKG